MIVWKHHVAETFKEDPKLLVNNGAGQGGHAFSDLKELWAFLSTEKHRDTLYYVAPIRVEESEIKLVNSEPKVYEMLISKKSEYFFADMNFWFKHYKDI